jgi:hypothetical protein
MSITLDGFLGSGGGTIKDEGLGALHKAEAPTRHADLDGKPVRLNGREAWWLVDGVWKTLHPADAGHDAKLISEEQFNSMFPSLPQLPSTAFQRHFE